MMDLFKKGVFTGLGLIILTAEEVEKKINTLVEKGKLTAEEGEEFIKEFIQKGEDQQKDFQDRVAKKLKSAMESLDIADKDKVENLEARISSLEDRVSTLESLRLDEDRKTQ
jgi:polyhydroxyalkanoate synthesis regulator phasin